MLQYLNFTFETVQQAFTERPPKEGDLLILAMPQAYFNRFRLVRVIKTNHTQQKRLIIDQPCCWGGASYWRNGKSCNASKGQTRLLPYVESIAALLKEDRDTILKDDVIEAALGQAIASLMQA